MALAATLMRPCDDADGFVSHVTALGSVLALLDGRKKAEALGIAADDRTGPSNALESCLRYLGLAGFEASFETIRLLARLRQSAPVHPKMDSGVLQAYARFGIDVPVSHWGEAWHKVADACRLALRHLRLVMEAGVTAAE